METDCIGSPDQGRVTPRMSVIEKALTSSRSGWRDMTDGGTDVLE